MGAIIYETDNNVIKPKSYRAIINLSHTQQTTDVFQIKYIPSLNVLDYMNHSFQNGNIFCRHQNEPMMIKKANIGSLQVISKKHLNSTIKSGIKGIRKGSTQ